MTACSKTSVIDPNTESAISLSTDVVTILASNQIKMVGEIKKLNSEPIQEIGFVLYDLDLDPTNPKEIKIDKPSTKEGKKEYTYTASNPFVIGKKYAYCIYVRTNKAFYKGNQVEFMVDQIKTDPEKETKAVAGTYMSLEGDFSQLDKDSYITLAGKELGKLPFEVAKDKKSIKILAPTQMVNHDDVIDIILNRKDPNGNNYFSRTIGKMKIIARIHPPKSYEIYYNQALPITGDALPYQKSSLNIIINGKKLPYYYGITIGEFGPINQSSLKWSIDDGVKVTDFPEPLQLIAPKPEDLSLGPVQIHPDQSVDIFGIDFNQYFGNTLQKVKIGSKEFGYYMSYPSYLSIAIHDLPYGKHTVSLQSSLFNVTLNQQLELLPFNISSISPSEIYPNEELQIKGNFIKGMEYSVTFNDFFQTSAIAHSNSEIIYKVPFLIGNNYEVKLMYNGKAINDQTQKSFRLKLLNPIITSLSAKQVNPGDVLILKGRGLEKVDYIFFENYAVVTERTSNEELKVKMPLMLLPGKYKIYLNGNNSSESILSNQVIEIL